MGEIRDWFQSIEVPDGRVDIESIATVHDETAGSPVDQQFGLPHPSAGNEHQTTGFRKLKGGGSKLRKDTLG